MPGHGAITVDLPPHGTNGLLGLPEGGARGIILFAHGSGSSRFSPRNTLVADRLQKAGLATLLFDLLTDEEATQRRKVFDIALLAERLRLAADWAGASTLTSGLPLCFFGASTGAAAALVAAAGRTDVKAIVSRGGRPDLASDALPQVRAPTLLIVGGADPEVLRLNREAQHLMRCECQLKVVPGATHLFEEPGALDAVVDLAARWLLWWLGASPRDKNLERKD
jgi:predicted alpha/beta-hydrolase family hydrolase